MLTFDECVREVTGVRQVKLLMLGECFYGRQCLHGVPVRTDKVASTSTLSVPLGTDYYLTLNTQQTPIACVIPQWSLLL